jgi:hypothetical protein
LFRKVSVLSPPSTSFYNITTPYNATFGSDVGLEGSRVFIRVRVVGSSSGYAGPWLYASTIIL